MDSLVAEALVEFLATLILMTYYVVLLSTAGVPAVFEPNGLVRDDGKSPDGMSLLPWKMGRPLVWDATCVDTLAPSHLPSTAGCAGAAAATAETLKQRKYSLRTSTEIVTQHFIDMDHGIPLNIHARPRLVGRRPNAIVNIETDVFQEKSYKQYSSQHLRDALIAVKKGYSVYAASNKYGVPRKTLRNWMEKYDIKSQFSKDFPIANVQCQYDSPSDTEPECRPVSSSVVAGLMTGMASSVVAGTVVTRPADDHTYDTRDEPPAFIIQHVNAALQVQTSPPTRFEPRIAPKIMTICPGTTSSVNVIHVGEQPQMLCQSQPTEFNINKRIRRSEQVLRQAADCVSRGLTFQTVSEQFKIPISTIRFFMARKGILPQRRRGRATQLSRPCNSPEPPFHMQHFKLPDMVSLRPEDDDTNSNT